MQPWVIYTITARDAHKLPNHRRKLIRSWRRRPPNSTTTSPQTNLHPYAVFAVKRLPTSASIKLRYMVSKASGDPLSVTTVCPKRPPKGRFASPSPLVFKPTSPRPSIPKLASQMFRVPPADDLVPIVAIVCAVLAVYFFVFRVMLKRRRHQSSRRLQTTSDQPSHCSNASISPSIRYRHRDYPLQTTCNVGLPETRVPTPLPRLAQTPPAKIGNKISEGTDAAAIRRPGVPSRVRVRGGQKKRASYEKWAEENPEAAAEQDAALKRCLVEAGIVSGGAVRPKKNDNLGPD